MVNLFSSLRFKFALLLGLFAASLLLAVMSLLEHDIRTSLIKENIGKGVGIAGIVALNTEDPLLTGDDIYLFSVVKNAALAPGIRYAMITDRKRMIRAADDMSRVGQEFVLPAGDTLLEESAGYRVRRLADGQRSILDIEVPVVSRSDRTLPLGNIHLGLSEDVIIQAVADMRRTLVVLSCLALLLGSAVAYAVAGMAVRPIHALVTGVKAVGAGDLNQHIDLKRNDELGILTEAFNEMTESLQEKEYIKHSFERYVSKELAQQVLKHKNELRLGGEEKVVTILFCDLRGFTSLAEQLAPAEVVEFLNMYFTEVLAIVSRFDGMVDKFMGDAVMVLFGAPLPVGNEADKAIACALEIREAVEKMNQRLLSHQRPTIAVGIGINTGAVVAGNIGSQNRMEYTVIGDNVNLSSRLESLNKYYGTTILVAEPTLQAIAGATPPSREIDRVQVLGKACPVSIYELSEIAQDLREGFATAVGLYRRRDFTVAMQHFQSLYERYADPPSQLFQQRCAAFLATPPPEGWDGTFVFARK